MTHANLEPPFVFSPQCNCRRFRTFSQSETAPMPSAETSVPAYGTAGMVLMATAAVGLLAAGAQRMKVARKATHGIKFSYSIQKDAYADLEFMNDVGC